MTNGISLKVKCDTKQLRKELRMLRKSLWYTSVVNAICNWFRKDKIKVNIDMVYNQEDRVITTKINICLVDSND